MSVDSKKQLESAILSLEAQRPVLGDEAVDAAIHPLQQKLDQLQKAEKRASGIEGERKLVTIMFADVSGFTALSENMDPEAVRDLMNACFSRLVPVIEKYRGTVDKFIGDEIMALFGAPAVMEDDPKRALRSALEMMQELKAFRNEKGSDLDLHIGINTGLVIAGNIGSEGRQQYTVMGDAVNVASRLCDLSERGEIIVGPDTYKLTRNEFEFEKLDPVRVKGKKEPLQVYRLMDVTHPTAKGSGEQLLRSKLVGRSAEMSVLESALANLTKGKGHPIAIIGEAGIGKSRLVYEMQQKAGTAIRWVKGRALSYSGEMSYWPVREVVHDLAGIPRDTTHSEISHLLEKNLKGCCRKRVREIYPYLCRLLDVPPGDDYGEDIRYYSPEALREKITSAVREYIRANAKNRPLVIEWEDLHWADPSSLSMLESMVNLTFEVPVVHLFIFRPLRENRVWSFHQQLMDVYQEDYQVVKLSSLTIGQSTELVHNLTHINTLPDDVQSTILYRAEGNPFFIEELVRSLLDQGYISVKEDKLIIAKDLSVIDIPNTLQEVLTARIDNLAPSDKDVLQTAAIVGRIFQHRVLKQMLTDEDLDAKMEPALRELQKRELIRFHKTGTAGSPGLPSDLEYIFKHVITQEVTYNTILLAKRKILHELAAKTLEVMFSGYLEEFAATLAFHYERAGRKEKAVQHLIVAANRSREIYANEEAIALYRAAIDSLEELYRETEKPAFKEQIAGLRTNLGDVLQLSARNNEAVRVYEEGLAELPAGDILGKARLIRKMGEAVVLLKDYKKGTEYYDEALRVMGAMPEDTATDWWNEWIDIHLNLLWLLYWQSLGEEMLAVVNKIEKKVNLLGTPSQVSKLYSSLCLAGLRNERYLASDQTVSYAEKSAKAIETSSDLVSKAMALFLHGFALLWNDDFEPAVKPFRAALDVTEKTGDLVVQTRVLNYLAVLYRRMNNLEKAREFTERTLESALKSKMPEYIGSAYANFAWMAYRDREYDQVMQWYHKASDEWSQIPNYKAFLVIRWLVLFPVLHVYVSEEKVAEAIGIVSEIIEPAMKKLPDDLTDALKKAVDESEAGNQQLASAILREALHLASEQAYL